MKQIVLLYALITLICIALLSLLSYGAGPGYVYVLWHGVQLQTNLWLVVIGLLLLGFISNAALYSIRKYVRREKLKVQHVLRYEELHPFERLGVLWLLGAEAQQTSYVQPVFDQSALLQSIVQANLLTRQGQPNEALQLLESSSVDAFELAELERIKAYLALNQGDQALTHLEFLKGHQLSPWLQGLEQSYQQKLVQLWGDFAVQFPWTYLKSTQYGHLETATKLNWLAELLKTIDSASDDDLQLLKERYLQQQEHIESLNYDIRTLWLKLLSRLPEMSSYHYVLAVHLLSERFEQDVFYLWFQQQLLKQNPDYTSVEHQINAWQMKYPSMPVLSFALWHIYMATERQVEAQQLLDLYPENILMNYLRIKATLDGDELLIQQLNAVFENDSNFIQVKI